MRGPAGSGARLPCLRGMLPASTGTFFCTVAISLRAHRRVLALARQLAGEHGCACRCGWTTLGASRASIRDRPALPAQSSRGRRGAALAPTFRRPIWSMAWRTLVIEAFACHLPEAWVAGHGGAGAETGGGSIWSILSAENWCAAATLASPQARLPLTKHFYSSPRLFRRQPGADRGV